MTIDIPTITVISLSILLLTTGISTSYANATAPIPLSQGLMLRDVIETTLKQQPSIGISREQKIQSGGTIKLTRSEFDWELSSNLNHGADYLPTGASTLHNKITYSLFDVGLIKKTYYGFSLGPALQLKKNISDAAPGNGGTSAADTSMRLSFTLVLPLLQGAGQTVGRSRGDAAELEYQAAKYELLHTISQSVYEAINAYWRYVAAAERLQLAMAAEERAGSIVANTSSLVHADESPQAELVSAEANLLEKKISREQAELDLIEARQSLGVVMGAAPDESTNLLLPGNRLPAAGQNATVKWLIDQQRFISGVARRNDLIALIQRMKATEKLVIAAKDALKPKLDLVSAVGYDGYQTGDSGQKTIRTFENRQSYPDWSVGLRFSYPIGNNRAEGNYSIAVSQHAQSRIRMLDLQRNIEISLRTSLQTLVNVAREIDTAERAVAAYRQSVDNEREKYQMGESTLFDLLFTQDKLESAHLSRIDACLRGALLLTRLHHESGQLLSCDGDACELTQDAVAMFTAAGEAN